MGGGGPLLYRVSPSPKTPGFFGIWVGLDLAWPLGLGLGVGWLDNFLEEYMPMSTGRWSGSVGLIQRDEVDYATCCFAGTYDRSTVASFAPGIYEPYSWFTRYPREISPTWNLVGLFTKEQSLQISTSILISYNIQGVPKNVSFILHT